MCFPLQPESTFNPFHAQQIKKKKSLRPLPQVLAALSGGGVARDVCSYRKAGTQFWMTTLLTALVEARRSMCLKSDTEFGRMCRGVLAVILSHP